MTPKLRGAMLIVVFWPWIFIALEGVLYICLTAYGCQITAIGPEPCVIMGANIGEHIYGLWTIGFQVAFSLPWVFFGVLLFGVLEWANARPNRS